MKFTINWLERKSPEWIIANLINEKEEEIKDVSINKISKKGETFPDFDNLASGGTVEGEPWVSGTGKNYLFPPKPKLEAPSFMKKPNMDRIMDKKANLIGTAQETKAKNIAEAQDRSAWMWAKTSASTLISHHPSFQHIPQVQIFDAIEDLATKIYNSEPLVPFN